MHATLISVLRFSPMPELQEHVNVALIVPTGGRTARVLYDPDFPRLRCSSPRFSPSLMKEHLDLLPELLAEHDPVEWAMALARISPQFVLGGQHEVPYEATDSVARSLVDAFLAGHAPTRRTNSGKRIASMIAGFMRYSLGVGDSDARSNARLGDLLKADLAAGLKRLRIPRAIIGSSDAVLLNGLSFGASASHLRERAEKIRFAGYGLAENRELIQEQTGLRVHCGTVLFDEPTDEPTDEQRFAIDQVREFTTLLSTLPNRQAAVRNFATLSMHAATPLM